MTALSITEFAVPFIGWRGVVPPEWIDSNGHMNSVVYAQLFDDAMRPFFRTFLMGEGYNERTSNSVFQREFRVSFERELMLGDPLEIRSFLYAHDAKRMHHVHELWHAGGDGQAPFRAAFGEYMSLHVDMTTRRVAPFPAEILQRLDEMAAAFARLPQPDGAGKAIGIPKTLENQALAVSK